MNIKYKLLSNLMLRALFLSLLTGCAPTVRLEESSLVLMPGWFWRTTVEINTHLAVGYAPVYYNLATSYDAAFDDAALRMFTDRRCRIVGERGSAWEGSAVMSLGSNLRIEADTAGFAVFKSGLARLDSISSAGLAAMLVGTRITQVDKMPHPPPPIRDIQLSTNPTVITGLGSALLYHQPASSWLEAERTARLEAAMAAATRMRGEAADIGSSSLKTTLIEVDVQMKNIRTIARTIDTLNKTVWIKVEAKVESTGNFLSE